MLKSQRILYCLFSTISSGLCRYHLFIFLHSSHLLISKRITGLSLNVSIYIFIWYQHFILIFHPCCLASSFSSSSFTPQKSSQNGKAHKTPNSFFLIKQGLVFCIDLVINLNLKSGFWFVYLYLPTPPLGQDMAQGQFLTGV